VSADFIEDDEDADPKEKKKKHEEFLLAEYSSIAQAYFNTISTIATFFRNYLVIVGLPIPILSFVLTQLSKPSTPGQNNPLYISPELTYLVPLTGGLIWALGFCLMLYVVNLRLDALLYARTVNGLRKYFYDKSPIDYPKELQMRVLPRTPTQPRYWEPWYFLAVIFVFALLNTIYPIIGISWYVANLQQHILEQWPCTILLPTVLFCLHFAAYLYLTHYRETKYLRRFIIGVDIDGVLNKHRDTFCTKLWQLLHKTVWADQIKKIPVHYQPELGVSQADEWAVFNHPDYWKELAPAGSVADMIAKLRNVFGYRVFVFTHRGWPEIKQFPTGQVNDYKALWKRARWWWPGTVEEGHEYRSRWNRFKLWCSLLWASLRTLFRPLGKGAIRALTIKWLHLHGIGYDRLVVEWGNVHTSGPGILTHNRFTQSERYEIRVFVEDDLFKAIKLANVCEIVFLVDHPYNRDVELPRNVKRVFSWKEIHDYIREHL
jgi:uncharacterized HAD superfamily protein